MKYAIESSSSIPKDDNFIKMTIPYIEYLAKKENSQLIWGDGDTSIMGLCYDIFVENKREILGYTTKRWTNLIPKLPHAKHEISETTFDLKKHLFYDSDVIVFLPGGIGTISEFFAFIEEMRSNEVIRPVILCNINNCYDSLINLIDNFIEMGFNNSEFYSYFTIISDFEGFKCVIDSL